MQEVSSAHITHRKPFERNPELAHPMRKEQIHLQELHPHYVAGFIDGEGSFSVSIGRRRRDYKHPRTIEVRPEFAIELRADDGEILERILVTIGCGKIYDCSYDRYGWYPHRKYKITSVKELISHLFPFLDKYPLQAKKAKVYHLFKEVVLMYARKEHLTERGFKKVMELRDQMRMLGKKTKVHAFY